MSGVELAIYGVVVFFSTIAGGMAGGGAGFILTPLLIFMGLTPAESIATGKAGSLVSVARNIQILSKEKLHSWRFVVPFMVTALVIGLIAPQLIVGIDDEVYKRAVGVLLLVMIPVMYFKKVGTSKVAVGTHRTAVGAVLLVAAMVLQAVFSSGLGVLVNIVLIWVFGMGALEANITKRYSQLVLNVVTVIGLLFTGLIVWEIAIVNAICAFAGTTIGARLAVKKGNATVMYLFMVIMGISGVRLLVS